MSDPLFYNGASDENRRGNLNKRDVKQTTLIRVSALTRAPVELRTGNATLFSRGSSSWCRVSEKMLKHLFAYIFMRLLD